MSNYYTPSIEEFHVGMEFELLDQTTTKMINDRKWHTVTVSPNNNEMGVSVAFNRIPQLLKRNEIRVKLLDNEDLESLGFVESKNKNLGITEYIKYKLNWGFNDQSKYSIYQMNGVWNMVVTEQNSYDSPTAVFRINVKNKSELKKLMNMLQIN